MQFYRKQNNNLNVVMDYDIVIVGGGIGGVAASHALAKSGLKVLLVEENGIFGGVTTNCQISSFSQRTLPGVYKPTFLELLEAYLKEYDVIRGSQFSPDYLTRILDNIVENSRCDYLLHTRMISLKTMQRRVESIVLHNKSGLFTVKSNIFIDATGDGDLCYEAGSRYELGNGTPMSCQPMTTSFYVSGVDIDRMLDKKEINNLYIKAKSEGSISNPRENVLFFEMPESGTLFFNTTRIIHHDGTDGKSLTEATLKGRKQVFEMLAFLKKLPGFERAYLQRIGNKIGVRETRRFLCDYVLSHDDMLASRKFEDAILATSAHLDIHNPHGPGTRFEKFLSNTVYEVPYRCLIPKDLDNVIIGSRCLGATHEAFSAIRMVSHVGEYGRAAGFASAKAIYDKCSLREVDMSWVQEQLGVVSKSKAPKKAINSLKNNLYSLARR